MNVFSVKLMELSQTVALLSDSIRMEKGCQRCEFCQSIEDENRLFLIEEWDTLDNLMSHMKSAHFKVLRGARNLLKEPQEIVFHNVSDLERIEKKLIEQFIIKGGADEENNYFVNGFSDDGYIYRRMLGRVGYRS